MIFDKNRRLINKFISKAGGITGGLIMVLIALKNKKKMKPKNEMKL